MDTAISEAPQFKLAKVGRERKKRRGAGVPWFGGGSGGAGFSGAIGGSAAGGAGLAAKAVLLGLVAAMSAGAWQFGKKMRAEDMPAAKPKIFASSGGSYSAKDLEGVIASDRRTLPNSVGFVSGSLDGLTPEERARRAAEEAAKRKAEEEAAAAAAKEPAPAPEVAGAAAAPGMDANALLKAAEDGKDKKDGPFAKKFGSLSSGFGGLAGGAGLSGGVTQNFGSASLGSKADAGKAGAFRGATRVATSRAAVPRSSAGNTRGVARRQLSQAFHDSRGAVKAASPETSATTASQAFDNNAGQGNLIAGPGAGIGSAPAGIATPNNPSQPQGGSDNEEDYKPQGGVSGRNATRYQMLVDIAKLLLGVIAILSAIAVVFKNIPMIGDYLKWVLAGLGAVVAGLGVAIIGYGETMIGGIYTAAGALVTATALFGGRLFTSAEPIVQAAAGPLISSILGLLGGSFVGKGGAASWG